MEPVLLRKGGSVNNGLYKAGKSITIVAGGLGALIVWISNTTLVSQIKTLFDNHPGLYDLVNIPVIGGLVAGVLAVVIAVWIFLSPLI
jgi:hypothetical protein